MKVVEVSDVTKLQVEHKNKGYLVKIASYRVGGTKFYRYRVYDECGNQIGFGARFDSYHQAREDVVTTIEGLV